MKVLAFLSEKCVRYSSVEKIYLPLYLVSGRFRNGRQIPFSALGGKSGKAILSTRPKRRAPFQNGRLGRLLLALDEFKNVTKPRLRRFEALAFSAQKGTCLTGVGIVYVIVYQMQLQLSSHPPSSLPRPPPAALWVAHMAMPIWPKG